MAAQDKNSMKQLKHTKATSRRQACSSALYQVRNSQTSRLIYVLGQNPIKPRRQRIAMVVIGDDGGRVVAQEWNRNSIA